MRTLTDYLMEARKGEFITLASEDFAEMIRKVDETGKKGAITLTITVEPDKHGGREKKVLFDHSVKTPRRSARPAIFFSDDDGNLVREDPDQRPLFEDADERRAPLHRA